MQVDDLVCSNSQLGVSSFLSLQALLFCLCGVQAPVSVLPSPPLLIFLAMLAFR